MPAGEAWHAPSTGGSDARALFGAVLLPSQRARCYGARVRKEHFGHGGRRQLNQSIRQLGYCRVRAVIEGVTVGVCLEGVYVRLYRAWIAEA